ncbi:cytochrome b561 and DOMON domain-containing protein At5g47530-like, partial [Vigna umbellata]|uniref:cytochrome b561 and DOMON domain-containing protein At5g47530-like n=1 Tax=Vigna umbellata TaxID=87088 RepID=UPI001F5E762F
MSSIENTIFLFLTILVASIVPSISQSWKSYGFSKHINYTVCEDFSDLESSLYWNYHPSSNIVDVSFNKANTKDSNWVALAINPTLNGMLGSQAFVAIHTSNVTIRAYISPKTSYVTMLQEGNLSFSVYSLSASYTLRSHSFSLSNLRSYGTINFISDKVSKVTKDVNSQTVLRNVFDFLGDTWFHLHLACQSLAFFIVIVGFGTGLYIGKHYGVHHAPLQCVGIILMCLASAQICVAVFFGPKKDHKY